MSRKPKLEIKTINLFEFLGEGLIRKLEAQPIQVEFSFADVSRTVEITKKHPWYKQLKRRREEQIDALRAKLRNACSPAKSLSGADGGCGPQ